MDARDVAPAFMPNVIASIPAQREPRAPKSLVRDYLPIQIFSLFNPHSTAIAFFGH